MIRLKQTSIATTAAFVAAVVVVAPAWAQRDRLSLAERVERLEAQPGGTEDRQTMADLVLRLSQMEQEIRELRGLVEDQAFELDNLKASQRDLYRDLDRRLAEGGGRPGDSIDRSTSGFAADRSADNQDSGAGNQTRLSPGQLDSDSPPRMTTGSASTRPVASNPAVTTTGVVPLNGDVPEVRNSVDSRLQTSGLDQTTPVQVAELADPVAEKAAYNEAFDALKNGRYAESARLFSTFLDRFPSGEFADNAQYWLGESYYVTGNYRIALEAFQDLLSRFPSSAKAPDARLKLGYTYFSLQEWPDAERVLKQVIGQYPNSTVSRLAENRLRTMRIQGHIQ
jgi:tol-pal system protein YbgF